MAVKRSPWNKNIGNLHEQIKHLNKEVQGQVNSDKVVD